MSTTYTVAGKRIVIHDREEWEASSQQIAGPAPSPELVHHFVVHWPGAANTWKPDSDVAAHLRAAQNSYLRTRGYSYGYGFVIGPNPIDWSKDPVRTDIWEVRGFDIRIASNDGDNGVYGQYFNPNFNGRSISAQIMASVAYPATNDQILQCRYLVALADRVYDETLAVIPHRTSDATTCPGDYITSKIPAIAVRPVAPTPPPPPPTRKVVTVIFAKRVGGTASANWTGKVSFDNRATWQAVSGLQWSNLLASGHVLDNATFRKVAASDDVTWTPA